MEDKGAEIVTEAISKKWGSGLQYLSDKVCLEWLEK